MSRDRLYIIDGHDILTTMQTGYRQMSRNAPNLVLHLETPPIQKDNVFLGLISNLELRRLWQQVGPSLFFENVRDFLGPGTAKEGRSSPNEQIIRTIKEAPERMLARNNGIVFRANQVLLGEGGNKLILTEGGIVNGCQTTMCLVNYAASDRADPLSYVSVKVVQTTQPWDIVEAANYQNAVADIDLKLARGLRPQLLPRAAVTAGYQIHDPKKQSATEMILYAMYDRKVTYDETRLLYIGIFSRTPNNVFAANYTELMQALIDKFDRDDPHGQRAFEPLFALQSASQEGLQQAEKTFTNSVYADLFKRFYTGESLSYRCFVSILALCGATKVNILDRETDEHKEYERMKTFLSNATSLLDSRKKRFLRYYVLAVKVWMQEVSRSDAGSVEIRRDMSALSRKANFTGMLRNLSMDADLDEALLREEQEFGQNLK
jgi:hypothetical protein